ncbi:MAG: dodecin family protein [Deltaproteobacteria bacterium]|nr:dodecin family protein [Deltaproteobacteria bacterium]
MERTYKQIELIGISEESYEQAIRNAISKASQSLRGINWYEVMEQRGRVVDGKVTEYQVIIKVAFKLE